MKRRLSTRVALLCALLDSAACGTEVRHVPGERSELVLRLHTPPFQNAMAGVSQLRFTLRSPDGVAQEWYLNGSTSEAVVDGEAQAGVILRVEGLDGERQVVSSGQSPPFDLQPGAPAQVEILFARVGELTPLRGNLRRARFGHTATVLGDGRVLVVGGALSGDLDAPGALAPAELYDPIAQDGCLLDEAGCPPSNAGLLRIGHAACATLGGDAFIHGGRDEAGLLVEEVLIYEYAADRWLPVPGVNLEQIRPRTDHAVAAVRVRDAQGDSLDAVLLAGGLGEGPGGPEELADAALLDTRTRNFIRAGLSLGRPRAGHSLTPIGGQGERLVLAGGQNQAGLVAEVEVFDGAEVELGQPFGPIPVAGELALDRLSTPRLRHAAVAVGSDVFVLGGDDGLVSLDAPELVTLDDELGQGVVRLSVGVAPAGHVGRRGALAAPLPSGAVLWVGGEALDGFERQRLDSAELLIPEPASNQVGFVDAGAGTLVAPISFPGVAVLPGGGVLLLGGLRGGGAPVATDEVWYYNPR